MKLFKTSRTLIKNMLDREEQKSSIRDLELKWMNLERHDNESAFNIMVDWLREQLKFTGLKGILLGVSGGIDSTLAALLLAKALPKEKAQAMYLPYGDIMEEDYKDVVRLLELLDLPLKVVNIKPLVDSTINQMSIEEPARGVTGNLMSRLRTTLMYYEANVRNFIVMGTGDLDESYVGYWTKGMVSDISPIASLHKSEIRKLILFGLSSLDEEFAVYMASKVSSPGYWPGQKAEDELGLTYDKIQESVRLIKQHCTVWDTGVLPENASLFEKDLKKSIVSEEEFLRVIHMLMANYHKSFTSPTLHNNNKYKKIEINKPEE